LSVYLSSVVLLDQTEVWVRVDLLYVRVDCRFSKLSHESLIDAVLVLWRHWRGSVYREILLKEHRKRYGRSQFASVLSETAESPMLRLRLGSMAMKGIPIVKLSNIDTHVWIAVGRERDTHRVHAPSHPQICWSRVAISTLVSLHTRLMWMRLAPLKRAPTAQVVQTGSWSSSSWSSSSH